MNIGDEVETVNNNGDVLIGKLISVTQEDNSLPRYTVVITKGRFSKEKISKPFIDFIPHRAHLTQRAPDARKSAPKSRSKNSKGSAKPARG